VEEKDSSTKMEERETGEGSVRCDADRKSTSEQKIQEVAQYQSLQQNLHPVNKEGHATHSVNMNCKEIYVFAFARSQQNQSHFFGLLWHVERWGWRTTFSLGYRESTNPSYECVTMLNACTLLQQSREDLLALLRGVTIELGSKYNSSYYQNEYLQEASKSAPHRGSKYRP
jgi:hypothetical protein